MKTTIDPTRVHDDAYRNECWISLGEELLAEIDKLPPEQLAEVRDAAAEPDPFIAGILKMNALLNGGSTGPVDFDEVEVEVTRRCLMRLLMVDVKTLSNKDCWEHTRAVTELLRARRPNPRPNCPHEP